MIRIFPTRRDLALTIFNLFSGFVKMADLPLMFLMDELSEDLPVDFLIYLGIFFQMQQIN